MLGESIVANVGKRTLKRSRRVEEMTTEENLEFDRAAGASLATTLGLLWSYCSRSRHSVSIATSALHDEIDDSCG